jgi:ATP-dependent Lon protease
MAAHRQGIKEVVLPKDNEKDLPDIPDVIKNEMKLHFIESMDQVLKIALEREVQPLPLPAPITAQTEARQAEDVH